MSTRCDKCDAESMIVIVNTEAIEQECRTEDGVFLLHPEIFQDPDHIDIQVICRSCGTSRALHAYEWEKI